MLAGHETVSNHSRLALLVACDTRVIPDRFNTVPEAAMKRSAIAAGFRFNRRYGRGARRNGTPPSVESRRALSGWLLLANVGR